MKIVKINVKCVGTKAIMFDKFVSMDSKNVVAVEDKFYYDADKNFVIPAINIMSFLSADLTESATKRTLGRKWKSAAKAALSFIEITPELIPITNAKDEKLNLANSGWYTHLAVAKVKKTGGLIVPVAKQRPVIPVGWQVEFSMTLIENDDLSIKTLQNIFEMGGVTVGFGTYRGVYGKFVIDKWEIE